MSELKWAQMQDVDSWSGAEVIAADASEIRERFSHYLNLVAYGAQQVVILNHGKPCAALVSMEQFDALQKLGSAS